MPSTSKKQHNFMEAVAHNASFAKKAGVPQSVGKDFAAADKAAGVKGGPRTRPDLQKVNEPKTLHGQNQLFKQGGNTMATKKMNPFAKFEASAKDKAMDKKEMGMKKGGMKKMAAGGSASSRADGVAVKGKTKGKMLAKGGMSKAKC